MTTTKSPLTAPECTVYFDGGCPLCAKEIATYQKWRGADQIAWVDASQCPDGELGVQLNRDAALARMHVRNANGELIGGAAAFVEMWRHLPALAWLTPVLATRPMLALLDVLYVVFLKIRPLWRRRTPT